MRTQVEKQAKKRLTIYTTPEMRCLLNLEVTRSGSSYTGFINKLLRQEFEGGKKKDLKKLRKRS